MRKANFNYLIIISITSFSLLTCGFWVMARGESIADAVKIIKKYNDIVVAQTIPPLPSSSGGKEVIEIKMSNGEVLEGEIKGEEDNFYEVESDGDTYKVNKDEVLFIKEDKGSSGSFAPPIQKKSPPQIPRRY